MSTDPTQSQKSVQSLLDELVAALYLRPWFDEPQERDELKKEIVIRVKAGEVSLLPILELLKHSDWAVRRNATEMLGWIGNTAATEPLVEIMQKDSTLAVSESAALALKRLGSPEALDAIQRYRDTIQKDEFDALVQQPWYGVVREYLWVTTSLTLEEFGDQLSNALQWSEFDFDYENVWEWGITKIEDNYIKVNISRKHHRGEPLLEEPLTVLFLVRNDGLPKYNKNWIRANLFPKFGQTIANLTKQAVYFGTAKHLGGDDFAYEPSGAFQPQV
jgi:hypothetical protein